MSKQQRNIRFTVATIVVFMALMVGAFVNRMLQPSYLTDEQLRLNGAYLLPTPRIIEPIDLLDHNSEPFTVERLQGVWSFVFFGFTHCPDVCPATLAVMRQFHAFMQENYTDEQYQIILVTVDPARDMPAVLKPYLAYFDPSFVGVTGEFMSLQRFASNLSSSFYKVTGSDGEYQVDHSANILLINPFGHYHGFYKPQLDPSKIKTTFRSIVMRFNRQVNN